MIVLISSSVVLDLSLPFGRSDPLSLHKSSDGPVTDGNLSNSPKMTPGNKCRIGPLLLPLLMSAIVFMSVIQDKYIQRMLIYLSKVQYPKMTSYKNLNGLTLYPLDTLLVGHLGGEPYRWSPLSPDGTRSDTRRIRLRREQTKLGETLLWWENLSCDRQGFWSVHTLTHQLDAQNLTHLARLFFLVVGIRDIQVWVLQRAGVSIYLRHTDPIIYPEAQSRTPHPGVSPPISAMALLANN